MRVPHGGATLFTLDATCALQLSLLLLGDNPHSSHVYSSGSSEHVGGQPLQAFTATQNWNHWTQSACFRCSVRICEHARVRMFRTTGQGTDQLFFQCLQHFA